MPKWMTACFAAALSITLLTVQAQTADDIINNYINAMGGKDKLSSIKSVYMEGVTVMQNGNELTSKTYKVQGQLYRREMQMGAMGSMTQIVTDKEGWSSNPRNGGAFEPLPEERLKNMRSELDCTNPLVNYAAKGNKAELIGKEDVEGTECYKIKCTLASGQEINYFIDPKTWYIIRESRKGGGGMGGGRRPGGAQGGDGELKIDYSNYQKTPEGFVFPYTISMGGMGAGMTMEKIEVNKIGDISKLSKPSN